MMAELGRRGARGRTGARFWRAWLREWVRQMLRESWACGVSAAWMLSRVSWRSRSEQALGTV